MTRRCGYCGEPLDRDGRCPRLATSLGDLLERGGEPLRPVTYALGTRVRGSLEEVELALSDVVVFLDSCGMRTESSREVRLPLRGGREIVVTTVGWVDPRRVLHGALEVSARRAESVSARLDASAFCAECGAEVGDPSEEGSTYESIRAGTECRCVVDRSKMSFEDFLAWSAEEIERAKRRRE